MKMRQIPTKLIMSTNAVIQHDLTTGTQYQETISVSYLFIFIFFSDFEMNV